MQVRTILRRRARTDAAPRDSSTSSRFVTTDGTALCVVDTVDSVDTADSAVTVVLVHGWTLDHRSWAPIVDRLRTEFGLLRLVRYDHRGHGGSAPAGPVTASIAQLADDLAEVVGARVPAGRIVLAGHSMGGMTVMALAERYPELVASRIAGVVLVGTSSCEMDRVTLGLPGLFGRGAARGEQMLGEWLARLRRPMLLKRSALLRPFVRWLVFGRGAHRTDVAEVAAQIGQAHPVSMSCFRDSIGTHDRRVALAVLRGRPVVVVVGDRDRLCPLRHARVIADALPEASLVVYPGAGHMLTYERPDEVSAEIARVVRAAL
ncbi:MAG: alpha/beta fold hydrolase [Sciscionella sp.]